MNTTKQYRTLVVGGTSGIGKAISSKLEQRGHIVLIASRKTGLDMSNESSVIDYLSKVGDIDNLIITAGSYAASGNITELSIGDAKESFDTKFWGSITVAKHAVKHLSSHGSITFTSGFLSRKAVAGAYVKSAMNAAIETTSKVMAKELAPIRVNTVSPGLTDTEAYAKLTPEKHKSMLENAAKSLPVGKVASAADIASAYILAVENEFMTGSIIDIDGGALIN